MVFLPQDASKRAQVKEVIEGVLRNNELKLLGWRAVPVDPSVLGANARGACPHMEQLFVAAPERLVDDDDRDGFERTLYLVRRRFDVELRRRGLVWDEENQYTYFASFSSRTIVYKGMVQVREGREATTRSKDCGQRPPCPPSPLPLLTPTIYHPALPSLPPRCSSLAS